MIWARREFYYADYSPYFDRMKKLLMSNPTQYREFMMVSIKTTKPGVDEFYIGLPSTPLLALFDGFETVPEELLPKVIDTLHIADATTDEFKNRFTFKHSRR